MFEWARPTLPPRPCQTDICIRIGLVAARISTLTLLWLMTVLTGPPRTAMRAHGVSDVSAATSRRHVREASSEPREWRSGMHIRSLRSLYWARNDRSYVSAGECGFARA